MQATPRHIAVYQELSGKLPYLKWLKSLRDTEAKAAVTRRIRGVSQGNFGDCSRYGQITELRLDLGPGYRVYLGQEGAALVILLAGGDKRTQKKDFEKARRYWNDYKERGQTAVRPL